MRADRLMVKYQATSLAMAALCVLDARRYLGDAMFWLATNGDVEEARVRNQLALGSLKIGREYVERLRANRVEAARGEAGGGDEG